MKDRQDARRTAGRFVSSEPHSALPRQQRVYVATTGQVWALYDLFPERVKLAVLLGAFVGLHLGRRAGCGPRTLISCGPSFTRSGTVLTNDDGRQLSPRAVERAMRTARKKVQGLPAGFRYRDLRHCFASLLIASGADVKTVQARLRHASAKTTLDTYGHIWPDRDESTRAAIEAVITPGRNRDEAVR
jgi:integrase